MAKKRQSGAPAALPPVISKYVKITYKTENQKTAGALFDSGKQLLLAGYPGTGKTLLAMNFAVDCLYRGAQDNIVIVRSAVPTRDMGFAPGSIEEKAELYEAPYQDICKLLFPEVVSPYAALKGEKIIRFMTTSYVRGISLRNAVVIIDECQSMTRHELFSVITRVGVNCRVILCGDQMQNDLTKEQSGFRKLMSTVNKMRAFGVVQFNLDDILRSGFTKEFITTWIDDGEDSCPSDRRRSNKSLPNISVGMPEDH